MVIGKKKRLVINGIPLNHLTAHTTFNLPSISELTSIVSHKNMMAISFDLKDAFYAGAVTPDNALDQCIRWRHPITGKPAVFAMSQKIFGHHASPRRFMRVHCQIFEFLRKIGVPSSVFVDDGLLLTLDDEPLRKLTSAFTKYLLWKLWTIIKAEKSNLEGAYIIEWIGYVINLKKLTLEVPPKHVNLIKKDIKELLSKKRTTPKELAKVKGRIVSKRHAIRYASILTSSINVALADEFRRQSDDEKFVETHENVSWTARMDIPKEVRDDLLFLVETMGTRCILPLFHYKWDFDIYVDTSATHTGAHSKFGEYFVPIHPIFMESSSTTREMWGVYVTLRHHGEVLRDKKVRIFSDNLSVATVTNRNASSHFELRAIHKAIVKLVEELHVTFWIRWKRRNTEGIQIADALSKSVEYDEWSVDMDKLATLCNFFEFPYPSLDCFASSQNAVAAKYFSATWDPTSEGLDFFSQIKYDFSKEWAWINPPFQGRFIMKTVDSIIAWKINGILCVPAWLKSTWYWVVKRFAKHLIRVTKRVNLFKPNERMKRVSKKEFGAPKWDTFLCVFDWQMPRRATQYWITEDMQRFDRIDRL